MQECADVPIGKRTRTAIAKKPLKHRPNNDITTKNKRTKSNSMAIKVEQEQANLRQSKRTRRRIICKDDSSDDDEDNSDEYVFNGK